MLTAACLCDSCWDALRACGRPGSSLGDVLHEARMKIAADKANKEASKDADAASEAEEGEVM